MKKNIVYLMLASLLLFTGCADYLDQDPEDLNSMDKIFSSKIETTKWYNRIYSDDFTSMGHTLLPRDKRKSTS